MPTAQSTHHVPYGIPRELKNAHGKNHIALGIGAGVSNDSKLLTRSELVSCAAGITGVGEKTAKALLVDGFDAIAVAAYLRARGNGRAFPEAVRKALYQDFKFEP